MGGRHTASNPLPPKTRSTVAPTAPRFRCRSHITSRRLSCGNMASTVSACAGVKRMPPLFDKADEDELCEEEEDDELEDEKKRR